MNAKEKEQIRSYSRLIVRELHKAIFDDHIYDKLKETLSLAEELEIYLMQLERKEKTQPKSNVVPFWRSA